MEMEGLIQSQDYLRKQYLTLGTLVTDRHMQAKWVRENLASTDHGTMALIHADCTHAY